jgi:hypothetical protein
MNNESRKPYEPPAVVYEAPIEVRAGSPLQGTVLSLFASTEEPKG